MTTNEQLIRGIVSLVDTYATWVMAPGDRTPTAYEVVSRLIQDAVGDGTKIDVPGDLLEGVEIFIRTRWNDPPSVFWEYMLVGLLQDMDDLAEAGNE